MEAAIRLFFAFLFDIEAIPRLTLLPLVGILGVESWTLEFLRALGERH